jgi:hypothetical protein
LKLLKNLGYIAAMAFVLLAYFYGDQQKGFLYQGGFTLIAILGGVHGDEFEGVLAARQIRNILQQTLIRGTVKFAAPAHPIAWNASTRTSPTDELKKMESSIASVGSSAAPVSETKKDEENIISNFLL